MQQRSRSQIDAPAPTLLIGVMQHGDEVRAEVQRLLPMLGATWQIAVTPSTIQIVEGALVFRQLTPADSRPTPMPVAPDQAAVGVSAVASLAGPLDAAIRGLRTDAHLFKLGLDRDLAPPAQVIVVADLTDPAAAALIPALTALLAGLLADLPDTAGALLLGTGVYPDSELGASPALALQALHALNALADPAEDELRSALAATLAIDIPPPAFWIYLFDRAKEGAREVANRAELSLMMSNQVLAMLPQDGGLSLSRCADQDSAARVGRPFSAAAAVLLTYHSDALTDRLAAQLTTQALDALVDQPTDRLVGELLEQWLHSDIGDSVDWAADLATAAGISATRCESWCDLSIADPGPQFDLAPLSSWPRQLASYRRQLEQLLPQHLAAISQAERATQAAVAGRLTRWIEALPLKLARYPGGLAAGQAALARLAQRERAARYPVVRVPDARALAEEAQLVAAIPALPQLAAVAAIILGLTIAITIVGRIFLAPAQSALAACFALVIALLVATRWYSRRRVRARRLAELCADAIRQQHLGQLAEAILHAVGPLEQTARQQLEGAARDLSDLRCRLIIARGQTEQWAAQSPIGHYLRPEAANDACFTWLARAEALPPAEAVMKAVEAGCLHTWRKADAFQLATQAHAAMRRHVLATARPRLDKILAIGGGGLGATLEMLEQRTRIPLRPSFDRLGSDAVATIERGALVGPDLATPVAALIERSEILWHLSIMRCDQMFICWRVCHHIPLEAIMLA